MTNPKSLRTAWGISCSAMLVAARARAAEAMPSHQDWITQNCAAVPG